MTKTKSKRIFYFDALRALAIFSVIVFHVFLISRYGIFKEYVGPSFNWIITDISGTCFRCGVDLFLMLSGALSLGRVWDIKSFLGKRLPRITLPFLFWGFILSVLLVLLSMNFPTKFNIIDTVNLSSFLNLLYNSYMAKTFSLGQYWFFWMILGTYLIMPVLNKWLLHSDLKEAEYFLCFWLITCLFDNTLNIPFPITLTYFTGPIGMVVLGYYLRHTERKLFNNPYFSLLIFILSNSILIIASYLMSDIYYIKYFDRYSILIAFQVIGIFLLFKNFEKFHIKSLILSKIEPGFKKSVAVVAKYSYGIYLIHEFILRAILQKWVVGLPFKVTFVIYIFGTLIISVVILAILNRIPYINQMIGAK